MQIKIIDENEIEKWENETGYSIRITTAKGVSNQYIKVASLKIQNDVWQGKNVKQLIITDTMGDELELFNNGNFNDSWDEDDITKVKKGSVVAFRDDAQNCKLITGFDPKYLERLNKKYFPN